MIPRPGFHIRISFSHRALPRPSPQNLPTIAIFRNHPPSPPPKFLPFALPRNRTLRITPCWACSPAEYLLFRLASPRFESLVEFVCRYRQPLSAACLLFETDRDSRRSRIPSRCCPLRKVLAPLVQLTPSIAGAVARRAPFLPLPLATPHQLEFTDPTTTTTTTTTTAATISLPPPTKGSPQRVAVIRNDLPACRYGFTTSPYRRVEERGGLSSRATRNPEYATALSFVIPAELSRLLPIPRTGLKQRGEREKGKGKKEEREGSEQIQNTPAQLKVCVYVVPVCLQSARSGDLDFHLLFSSMLFL